MIAIGGWTVCILIATAGWYWVHKVDTSAIVRWSAVAPETRTGFRQIELPPRATRLLAHDEGVTAGWQEFDGAEWTLYFFRWNPSSATTIFHARQHRPDVCLPASGLRLAATHSVQMFDAGEMRLPFQRYTYEADGRSLYVFFCQWEDGPRAQTGLASSQEMGRILTAWKGRKHLGQQTLELILSGYASIDEASSAVTKNLPQLIRVDSPASSGPAIN